MAAAAFAGPFVLRDEGGSVLPPETDVAERLALLAAVADGSSPQTVRLLRPLPTAAFSRRDALLPGYPAAVEVARCHGFTPVLRPVGGRMAPYHPGCLVLDVAGRCDDPRQTMTARFEAVAALVVAALAPLGVDARVGPVPREYCPGEHSVNIAGTTKVAGTAQRQTRRAYLVSAVVVVDDRPDDRLDDPSDDRPDDRAAGRPLRAVTTAVYAALGLDLDPATVGAVADHAPGVTVAGVRDLLVAALAGALDLDAAVTAGKVVP